MATYIPNNNVINIYKNNSATIDCSVSGIASLSGYRPTMNVKKDFEDEILLTKDGSVDGFKITFLLRPTDTSLAYGEYMYDIIIDNSTNIYTVLQDKFIITNSVKYS